MSSDARKIRALVVDDDEPVRRILKEILADIGLDVVTCGTSEEAWRVLQSIQVHLLVTDWMLPGMQGPDLVRRIRASGLFPCLYVIMITGRQDRHDMLEGLEAGADEFLSKPFDETELRVRVRAGQRIIGLQDRLLEQNRALGASNASMMQELTAAGSLQRALIPARSPRVRGFEFASRFHPYGYVSGDMFGIFPLDERHVGVFVADVSGHGAASAMLSVTVSRLLAPVPGHESLVKRRLVHAPFYEIVPPSDVLASLREWFKQDETTGFFFTLIYGVLSPETGRLNWVSAGHLPPIHVRGNSSVILSAQDRELPVGLGLDPLDRSGTNELILEKGDRLYFYSDGITEISRSTEAWFSEEKLAEFLASARHLPLSLSLESVLTSAQSWAGKVGFDDDVTLVGMERLTNPEAFPESL